MTDYRAIYNHIVESEDRYNLAQNSPGFRTIMSVEGALSLLSGRSLDVGCGIGFAIERLAGFHYDLLTFGVDISDLAIEKAKARLAHIPGIQKRLRVLDSQTLPFDDKFFALVTCFDMLEHLDEPDIEATLAEIDRVLMPGGTFLCTVSCRKAGIEDQFGDNLHRTVRSPDWWLEKVNPERAEYDGKEVSLTLWKHKPRLTN